MSQPYQSAQQTHSLQAGGPGVLIADDDPEIRDLIYDALTHEGFGRVYLTKDGQECLELLTENLDNIRAVVLDLMMPNLSGAHVLANLMKLDPPALGVLLVSGHHDSLGALEEKYRDEKVPFYLESLGKPFDVTQLVARIKALLMRGGGPSALDGLALGRSPQPTPQPTPDPQPTLQPTPQPTPKSKPSGFAPTLQTSAPKSFQAGVQSPATAPSPSASQPALSADAIHRLSKQLSAVEGQIAGLNAAVSNLREMVDKLTP
jgi:CheY-like chemotaxis protein